MGVWLSQLSMSMIVWPNPNLTISMVAKSHVSMQFVVRLMWWWQAKSLWLLVMVMWANDLRHHSSELDVEWSSLKSILSVHCKLRWMVSRYSRWLMRHHWEIFLWLRLAVEISSLVSTSNSWKIKPLSVISDILTSKSIWHGSIPITVPPKLRSSHKSTNIPSMAKILLF